MELPRNTIRTAFGKGNSLVPTIGDHPDFMHLKGTDDTCYCSITTLFMDIESSTRLSLLYPLPLVMHIKNSFIRTAIQIVTAFDGHVHRIMGDAVMAYFGGITHKPEDASIDGLNCSAVLTYFAKNVVLPKLKEMGVDHDFGIRIGLDHGAEKDVLWSSYGYPGIDEVTATSFYVDVAAKLQHAASRNQCMLGQSILESLDFPEELVAKKRILKDGVMVDVPFVEPNHTSSDGKLLNYTQRMFDADAYLRCTPLGQIAQFTKTDQQSCIVKAEVFDSQKRDSKGNYFPACSVLPKERALRFTIRLPYQPMYPYSIKCKALNHGNEARLERPNDMGNHEQTYVIQSAEQYDNFVHWETTKYRGLHYMDVAVTGHLGKSFETRFGVYVE